MDPLNIKFDIEEVKRHVSSGALHLPKEFKEKVENDQLEDGDIVLLERIYMASSLAIISAMCEDMIPKLQELGFQINDIKQGKGSLNLDGLSEFVEDAIKVVRFINEKSKNITALPGEENENA